MFRQISIIFEIIRHTGRYRLETSVALVLRLVWKFSIRAFLVIICAPKIVKNRWVRLPKTCGRVAVPRGFFSELPPRLYYIWSEMHKDPDSGWWVVYYKKNAANTATFHIQEVYDNSWIWAFYPHTIAFSQEFELVQIIGN